MRLQFIHHIASTVGFSILQQFVGLGRQALIAAIYGLSREFDAYLVVFAVATMFVFNLSSVFDSVAVARLVQTRQRDGEATFWRASNRLLWQSALAGVAFAGVLIGLLYLVMPIVAAGFSPQERDLVHQLAFYFLPWAIVILPYYAITAHLKALWRFHYVFIAELATMAVSIAVLLIWHDSIFDLPLAYAAGYACGLLGLLACRGVVRAGAGEGTKNLSLAMGNQYLANQMGSLSGLVDRYFQSFLVGGGISALGYGGLLVNSLSSLMTFREIYVVPLATELGRSERLARMLSGIVLISVPFTCFAIAFAEPIVQVLFERGKFSATDTMLTAAVLQIMAISLLSSSLLAPMARLFQIMDRIAYSHLLYLVSLVGTASLQYLLVFRLGLDVYGIALATVGNSVVLTVFVAFLVRRCGIILDWRAVLSNGALAAAIALAALAISIGIAGRDKGLLSLIVGGGLYWTIVAAAYFVMRDRLRRIIGLSMP
ncbi:MAG: lipid II flippase MurJ [Xanthobacteraceae bacterium]